MKTQKLGFAALLLIIALALVAAPGCKKKMPKETPPPATEQVLSNWTQSMHHHQGTSDGGTFLTLAMSVHVVLASLPYLHSMMFPPTPKARRVLCLIMGIALAQWSLILLTARLYSGTGPFWL